MKAGTAKNFITVWKILHWDAGHNEMAISFPTPGNYTFFEEACPLEDHTLEGWWEV